ncbi:MAG: hypothetical protein P9L89_02700 [Candidatus Celaenobacter polaris]|nr:hypothetical protein [Candidatus Celaenobacter polaris]
MQDYELKFLIALLDTIIVETIVMIFLVKKIYKKDMEHVSWERLIFAGVFCSFASLPYLWFIAPYFLHTKALLYSVGEISVFLIESVIIYFILRIKFTRALIISLSCNLASFLLGIYVI